mmetsp:Transcript_15622/g.27943  ORF Transcript_15622/g.27943 Transcript_15622/m.27943 type:complete len:221 (+) Transcript_15622:3353-4015(+)
MCLDQDDRHRLRGMGDGLVLEVRLLVARGVVAAEATEKETFPPSFSFSLSLSSSFSSFPFSFFSPVFSPVFSLSFVAVSSFSLFTSFPLSLALTSRPFLPQNKFRRSGEASRAPRQEASERNFRPQLKLEGWKMCSRPLPRQKVQLHGAEDEDDEDEDGVAKQLARASRPSSAAAAIASSPSEMGVKICTADKYGTKKHVEGPRGPPSVNTSWPKRDESW